MRRLQFVGVASALVLGSMHPLAQGVVDPAQQPASASQPAPDPFRFPDLIRPGASGLTPPRLVKDVKPNYTAEAMRARIQGMVKLECIVELDGTVGAIRVVNSLDQNFGLDNEALRTVKQWRFVPGVKDGSPVRALIVVEMSFTLRSGPNDAILGWPDAFAIKQGQVLASGSNWADDVASASDLTVKFAYPPGWILAKGDHPARLLQLTKNRAPDARACSVSRPKPSTRQFSVPLSGPAFQELAAEMRRKLTADPEIELHGIGQIQIQGRLWVWTELSRQTLDLSVLPADAATEIVGAFEGMRVWVFATTEGAQGISVSCYVLKPRGTSEVEQQDQMRQAGADFAAILNRVSVRAQ